MDVGTTEDIQLAGVGGISGALPWAGCVLLGCPTFVESIETCSFRDQIALGDGEPVAPVAGLAMFSLTFLMCS